MNDESMYTIGSKNTRRGTSVLDIISTRYSEEPSILGRELNDCIRKLEAQVPQCQRDRHGLTPRACSDDSQERYKHCAAKEVTGKVYLGLVAIPFALAGFQLVRRKATQIRAETPPRFVFRSLKRFWFLLFSFLALPLAWFGYFSWYLIPDSHLAQLKWYESPGHLTALGFLLSAWILWLCRNKKVYTND